MRFQPDNKFARGGVMMSRKSKWVWVLTIALAAAGSGILRAQEAPTPPTPPEPPEPPENAQIFVMNDGAAHLGVSLSDVSTERAQELKLPAVAGSIVTHVQDDSAASKAGLKKGDAIMEFDGVRVRSSAELRRLIRETPVGRTVEMKVVRDGKTQVLSAKLEGERGSMTFTLPSPAINIPNFPMSNYGHNRAILGISGDDLTSQLAEYFGVKQGKGVLISEVTKGSAAEKAGLKAGDVIVQVEGKAIDGVDELRSALNDNFTGDTRKVSLTIVRDRQEQTITAELTRPAYYHQEQTWNLNQQTLQDAMAELQQAQAAEKMGEATQLHALQESARANLQSELEKQRAEMKAQWGRQLKQQMHSLQERLKELQNQRVAVRQNGWI